MSNDGLVCYRQPMDSKGLKFLLKLLSFPDYRAPLSRIKPTPKMKAKERNQICQQLRDRHLIDCHEEINTLTISAEGKSLLNTDPAEAALTFDELKLLQSASDPISPAKTGLPPELRSPIIENLATRGLLTVRKQIKEVWLTERGQTFLVQEYDAASTSGSISFQMLANYLQLIRQYRPPESLPPISTKKDADLDRTVSPKISDRPVTSDVQSLDIWQTIRQLDLHLGQVSKTSPKLDDREILQTVKQLDQELGTEGYLPIFHVREKLHSFCSRQELDAALYRLQEHRQIQLKSLEELLHYSPEYFEAAINRSSQGSLFFIVLN